MVTNNRLPWHDDDIDWLDGEGMRVWLREGAQYTIDSTERVHPDNGGTAPPKGPSMGQVQLLRDVALEVARLDGPHAESLGRRLPGSSPAWPSSRPARDALVAYAADCHDAACAPAYSRAIEDAHEWLMSEHSVPRTSIYLLGSAYSHGCALSVDKSAQVLFIHRDCAGTTLLAEGDRFRCDFCGWSA